jgi:hypothetical protein
MKERLANKGRPITARNRGFRRRGEKRSHQVAFSVLDGTARLQALTADEFSKHGTDGFDQDGSNVGMPEAAFLSSF